MMASLFLLWPLFVLTYYSTAYSSISTEPRIVLSKSHCGKKEYHNKCGTVCAQACVQYVQNCQQCVEGCFCKRPYLRSTYGGPCVKVCPIKKRGPPNRHTYITKNPQNKGPYIMSQTIVV